MKLSPIVMGFFYLGLGSLFTYLAIQNASSNGEMWNFYTILLMVLATIDFVYAIRFFVLKKRITQLKKKDENKKR
ncbi:YdiK family protein [Bacillus sp. RAR_GA_16]|uniref:YdiK family protein n=1 Tax=Bacillus sp. RAR_GA_16 TaxID=2876774 RepID=UPI001CCA1DCE|nr:YdiK family protein [Bacillus sp. RAR_GA_16]MCA0173734.1 YdiK family protein [Bacillus sp. RAR_GA_16]